MFAKFTLLASFMALRFLVVVVLGRSDEKHWQCRGKTMSNWEEIPDNFDKCKADFHNHKGPAGQKGPLCESVCMGRRLGVLTADIGAVNRSGVNMCVDYHIQEEARVEMKKGILDCEDKYGATVEHGATDPVCSNYVTFWTCMWIQAMQVCRTTFDPQVMAVKIVTDDQGNLKADALTDALGVGGQDESTTTNKPGL